MAYIGNGPGVASQRVLTTLTATAGQTTFVPSSGYTLGYVDVFLNGVKLIDGSDYTADNGVNIVLSEAAALSDTVEVLTYFPRGLSDGYTKAEADARYVEVAGDTMTGNLDVQGTVTADGLTVDTDTLFVDAAAKKVNIGNVAGSYDLNVRKTNSGGDVGFQVSNRDTSQTAGTRVLLALQADINNDGALEEFLHLRGGTSTAGFAEYVTRNGASMRFQADAGTSAVFNDSGANMDFRVESDSNANMLFVDAGSNEVGIGTSNPRSTLDVAGTGAFTTANTYSAGSGGARLLVEQINASVQARFSRTNNVDTKHITEMGSDSTGFHIWPNGYANGAWNDFGLVGGATVFNQQGSDIDFRVESNNFSAAVVVDAGSNLVGFVDIATAPWSQTSGQGLMTYRLTEGSMALTNNGTHGYAGLYINKFNATSDNRAISFYREGVTEGHIRLDATQGIKYSTGGSGQTGVVELNKAGITFDGGSNYLDDYEEGTWTPNLGGNYVAGSNNGGDYVKIGNMVHVAAVVEWTSGSGNPSYIQGLPFNAAGSISYAANSITMFEVGGITPNGANDLFYGRVGSSSSTDFVQLLQVDLSSGIHTGTPPSFSSAGVLRFSFTYKTS